MNTVLINTQSIQNDTELLFSYSYIVLSFTNLHTMINDLEINFRKSSLLILYEKKPHHITWVSYHKEFNLLQKEKRHKIWIYHRYQQVMEC